MKHNEAKPDFLLSKIKIQKKKSKLPCVPELSDERLVPGLQFARLTMVLSVNMIKKI